MRKLKIMEHISLDGVIQSSGEDDSLTLGQFHADIAAARTRLADEALLVVYPVLLGTGKRLFAEGTPPRSFESSA